MPSTVRIFCSYSHQDEDALNALKAHLAEVRRQGLIEDWHDRCIQPGDDWAEAIDEALESADLVLLLVSKDFLASDYCNGIELKRALERVAAGEARIVPVYIRPCYWKGAPFARFQGLPKDAKPVYSAKAPDAAWVEVVEGILRATRELRGEEAPLRGLARRSPGLERPRRAPWILAGIALLLAIGAALWWPPGSGDPEVAALLAKADSYMDTGRYDQALAAYRSALALDPGDETAVFGRQKAKILARIGPDFDAEAAVTELQALKGLHPDDAHLQVLLGRLAAIRGDAKQARSDYQRALELKPDLAQAWFALGVLARGEGRPEQARGYYEKAVAFAPGHRQYLTNLADLLLDQGDYSEALDRYEALLGQSPRLLLARLDAGNAARLAGNLPKAAWHHKRLLRDISTPGVLREGDNAAQWVFDLPQEELTMDAPDSKRGYALLAVALTRLLSGDEPGALQIIGEVRGLPDLERGLAVIDQDLRRLKEAQPEWGRRLATFSRILSPPASGSDVSTP